MSLELGNPQSRNEAILENMLGAENELLPPQSRIEVLLTALLESGYFVSPEEVAQFVSAWLDENITNPTNPVIDASLTVSGAAADAKITGSNINKLINSNNDLLDNKLFSPTYRDAGLPVSNSNININAPVYGANWNSYVIECSEGDIFTVYATGGTSAYAWAFIDENGAVLLRSTSNITVSGVEITAPSNTMYLVVNDNGGNGRVYKNKSFNVRMKDKSFGVMMYVQDAGNILFSDYNTSPVTINLGTKDIYLRLESSSITIHPSDILTAASSYQNLTISGNTITGTSYIIYYDTDNKAIAVKTSATMAANAVIYSRYPVLFACHYKSFRCGLIVDYMLEKRLEITESDTENNSSNINAIIQSVGTPVPTYYETHIENKKSVILQNMMDAGKNGETFIFITDIHWENNTKNSPSLINYLLNKLNINNLLNGGDLINQGDKSIMENAINNCITSFQHRNILMPCAFGNHDSNENFSPAQPDKKLSISAQYALMQKQAENLITYFTSTNDAGGWNFYYDRENTKIRFIVVDTGTNGSFTHYTELANCLLGIPSGYTAIIIGHWFRQGDTITNSCTNISNMIDAYNSKTTVTISGTTYDFSNASGEIALLLGGHAHDDYNWTTTGGTPVVLTDSDNGPRSSNASYPYVSGTITEQAFDVVTINYTARTIKFVRIGRGADRSFSY